MKKNKGYSFVELVICMAIMAALAAISFISLGILNNARAKDVSSKIDTQLHSLWVNTNAKSQDACIIIESDPDVEGYILRCGTYNSTDGFTQEFDSAGNEVSYALNNRIVVEYVPDGGSGTDVIQFNKSDGSVKSGAGTYNIYMRASSNDTDYSGKLMTKVVLNKSTGSHYID